MKNVWGALAGKEGWGVTSMGDENPDLKKGPQDTYGLNLIPSGSSSRMEDLYGNWWNITTSSTSFGQQMYKALEMGMYNMII